jgi:fatty acid desaturase
MADETRSKRTFQWEWVGIALVMYFVFYFLVLLVLEGGKWNVVDAARIWTIAGAFLIAAVAGYLSRGVTVWEIALAALIVTLLIMVANWLQLTSAVPLGEGIKPIITLVIVFLFSALGAWLGERIQRSQKKEKAE